MGGAESYSVSVSCVGSPANVHGFESVPAPQSQKNLEGNNKSIQLNIKRTSSNRRRLKKAAKRLNLKNMLDQWSPTSGHQFMEQLVRKKIYITFSVLFII